MNTGITVGMDMGDRNHAICILDSEGEVQKRSAISNTAEAIREHFGAIGPCLVALEAGTHSGWVSRILEELGHEVLVGNPRKLRVIWDSDEKDDNRDAEMLARIARFDRHLLHPIHHRGKEAHADLAVIKARDILVGARSRLITYVRGSVKATGCRIRACSTESFHRQGIEDIPEELVSAMKLMMEEIESLTLKIREYDRKIESLCETKYPETSVLRQVSGVGAVTSLAYILTIEESSRFKKSRTAGAFLGLTTKRDKSGATDKQLHITKAGNEYLRRLLVGSAQYIMGPFGPDCDLKRFGQKLSERGGKNAKKRAVVAVARKLTVILHHLWATGAEYDPCYKRNKKHGEAA